jgi:hypothetical protein
MCAPLVLPGLAARLSSRGARAAHAGRREHYVAIAPDARRPILDISYARFR